MREIGLHASDGAWNIARDGGEQLVSPVRAEAVGGGGFVGREAQLAALDAALVDGQAGRGSLFLIGGEPGIGKSRLADTFARGARDAEARVLWGKCWDGAGAPAYWPWIQVLRAHIRSTDRERLRSQLGNAAADVARILPELGDLLGELPPPAPETDASRFQLFDSTADFLRRMAADAPSVLILDDLHAADTPSILLLRFIAQQIADMRVVIVGTYRDIELTPDHPMTAAIGEMTRDPTTHVLALRGLSETEVGQLIEAATSRAARSTTVARLWRETGGNPLFVGEAVRLLAAEGHLDDDVAAARMPFTLPAGVREVIARRASQLSPTAEETLRTAAAIGPEFGVDLVSRLVSPGTDAPAALAECARTGLAQAITGGRYRFSHDLVREALYEEIEPAQKAQLHRRIAEAIEELYATTPDGHAAELAYHYFRAVEGAGLAADDLSGRQIAQKAHLYARQAGDQAMAAVAYEEASRLYGMSIAAVDLDLDPDPIERTSLLLRRGEAEARAGNIFISRNIFLEASQAARRSGQANQLAMAAVGYGGRLVWSRAGGDTRLPTLLQEALVLLGGDDDVLRTRLLARLACSWRSDPEQYGQSDVISLQALELARRVGDPATLAIAIIARFYATWWPDNVDSRVALADEMLTIATGLGEGELLMEANLLEWLTLAERGLMVEAKHRIDGVNRLAAQLRQPGHIWLGLGGALVPQALLEGRFDIAGDNIPREVLPNPVTIARDDVSAYRMHRFLLYREKGNLAESEPDTRAAGAEFPWYACHRAAHVLTLIELGQTAEAKAEFADLARSQFKAILRDNEWLFGMALASEACGLLGDAMAAADLYEQLTPFAGRHAAAFGEGSMGALDRYLGILATTLGRLDEAEAHFEAAIAHNEQMNGRPWAARTRANYAAMLRGRNRSGDLARAASFESTALVAAEAMGMTALAHELISRAQSATDAIRTSTVAAAAFRREGEYWSIAFGDDDFKLRDSKGLHYLALLLTEPGREFLALDLAREAPDHELRAGHFGDAGSQLDAEAKSAYRSRLHELQSELDEAEAANDTERAEKAREEMEFLTRELSRAVGLAGRDRAAGSASERARLSVTRAIRLALDRIGEHSPTLGAHLNSTVRTGTYCSYRPDTRLAIDWQT